MANSRPLKMAGFQAPFTGWFWAPADRPESTNLGVPGQLLQTVAFPKQLGDALVNLLDIEFANLIGHDHEEIAVMGQLGVHRVHRQGQHRRYGAIRQVAAGKPDRDSH